MRYNGLRHCFARTLRHEYKAKMVKISLLIRN
jgi:hypothetical protein